MKKTGGFFLIFGLFLMLTHSSGASEIKLKVQAWANNSSDFSFMDQEVAAFSPFNLLQNSAVQTPVVEELASPELLTDGHAGTLGAEGRVAVAGTPSRIVYYLGSPRMIQAIRVYSGNIDTRGNQDFEIRLANNQANPGQMPDFSQEATLSSGEVVLGANGGGFLTYFENEENQPLFDDQTYDWIEFRFWKTFGAQAGSPSKSASQGNDWGSLVELQVFANPEDSFFADPALRDAWQNVLKTRRIQRILSNISADIAFAVEHRDSMKLAIEDMIVNFPDDFEGTDYLERWEEFDQKFQQFDPESDVDGFLQLTQDYEAFRREVLLSNPILDFDKILLREANLPFLMPNWISNASRSKEQTDNALVTLDLNDLAAPMTEIVQGRRGAYIGDITLHWDADRCLVTALADNDTWQVFECNLEEGSLTQVTPNMGGDVNNVEGCYVPDGSTIFISTASMMGVPCIGGSDVVGNIYRVESDGKTVRQLTFEQDQDWCPLVLPNGRIMYLRWEYVDIPHYYSRFLFTMNPDGTNQIEHYGSGSFWPNSLFYAKPIPGQSSKFVGIVSGHHGVAREGELVIFDPSLGRKETEGVVQRIPGRDNPPKNVTVDTLVDQSWPKFLFPYPLSDDYFLVSCRMKPSDPWAIYLVDTFDNMLKIREEPGKHLLEPIPILEQEEPTLLTDRTKPGEKDATVFMTDVYFGQGLPNVPPGTVKKLRIFAVSYSYRGIGGHDAFGMESGWDGRRLIGEVPVFEDGSATFKIPANTPLVLQPLDENGAAVQIMRSWFVGMPGETESCIGCHETQNSVSPTRMTEAQRSTPCEISEFYGPERPFTFLGEVQPILDKYCSGCHDGTEPDRPNLVDTTPGPRGFSNSYHAIHGYVRRPGPESDIHVMQPMEYHSSTSELVQMLEKGHYNVELDQEAWKKLNCWIDLNVPYFGTWTEVAEYRQGKGTDPLKDISDRYVELKTMYADTELNFETDSYYSEKVGADRPAFVPPTEKPELDRSAPTVPQWPFDAETAQGMASEKTQLTLAEGISAEFVKIPAGSFVMGDEIGFNDEFPRNAVTIEKPFWMMSTEVTNEMFALYRADHDSRFIDQWNKDHVRPGYPANKPTQPVIRVSWQEAQGFCAWLSEKTGKTFRLPTEAQWEWAARAGAATPMWFGDLEVDFGKLENLADESTRLFVVAGVDPQPQPHQDWEAFIPRANGVQDGNMIAEAVGSYQPNPFGLHDMLGSVAEWTASDYRPYPYNALDGRNDGNINSKKVARGGSWRDRPRWARCGLRRPYESWQKVFNVGFRVICEEQP